MLKYGVDIASKRIVFLRRYLLQRLFSFPQLPDQFGTKRVFRFQRDRRPVVSFEEREEAVLMLTLVFLVDSFTQIFGSEFYRQQAGTKPLDRGTEIGVRVIRRLFVQLVQTIDKRVTPASPDALPDLLKSSADRTKVA